MNNLKMLKLGSKDRPSSEGGKNPSSNTLSLSDKASSFSDKLDSLRRFSDPSVNKPSINDIDPNLVCYFWAIRNLKIFYPEHFEDSRVFLKALLNISDDQLKIPDIEIKEDVCGSVALQVNLNINECQNLIAKTGKSSNPYIITRSVCPDVDMKVTTAIKECLSPKFDLRIPLPITLDSTTHSLNVDLSEKKKKHFQREINFKSVVKSLLDNVVLTLSVWSSNNINKHPQKMTKIGENEMPYDSKDRFLGLLELNRDILVQLIDKTQTLKLEKRSSKSNISGSINLSVDCKIVKNENSFKIQIEKLFDHIFTLANAPDVQKLLNILGLLFFCNGCKQEMLIEMVLLELTNLREKMTNNEYIKFFHTFLLHISSLSKDSNEENSLLSSEKISDYLTNIQCTMEGLLKEYNQVGLNESELLSKTLTNDSLKSLIDTLLLFRRLHKWSEVDDAMYLTNLITKQVKSEKDLVDKWCNDEGFREKIAFLLQSTKNLADSYIYDMLEKCFTFTRQAECLAKYIENDFDFSEVLYSYLQINIIVLDIRKLYCSLSLDVSNYMQEIDVMENKSVMLERSLFDFYELAKQIHNLGKILIRAKELCPELDDVIHENHSQWFTGALLIWVETVNEKIIDWVQNALEIDSELKNIDEDVKHSSSVVDMFGSISPHIETIGKFHWIDEPSYELLCKTFCQYVATHLENYALWLSIQVGEQYEQDAANLGRKLDSSVSNSFEIPQRMCTAMNNIVEVYDHMTRMFLPLGFEFDIENFDNRDDTAIARVVKDEFRKTIIVLKKGMDDLSKNFRSQLEGILSYQIKIILCPETDEKNQIKKSQSFVVKYDETKTSAKKLTGWMRRRTNTVLKNKKVKKLEVLAEGELTPEEIESEKRKQEKTEAQALSLDVMLDFLDQLLSGFSDSLYDDTFMHIVKQVWNSVNVLLLEVLLPDIQLKAKNEKRKELDSEKYTTLRTIMEECYNVFHCDGKGLDIETLENECYLRVKRILFGLTTDSKTIISDYVRSQNGRHIKELGSSEYIKCTAKQSSYIHDNITYHSLIINDFKVENCNTADFVYEVGMFNFNGFFHEYHKVENQEITYSVPLNMFGHFVHVAVYYKSEQQSLNKLEFYCDGVFDVSYMELSVAEEFNLSTEFVDGQISMDVLKILSTRSDDAQALQFSMGRLEKYGMIPADIVEVEPEIVQVAPVEVKIEDKQRGEHHINGHYFKVTHQIGKSFNALKKKELSEIKESTKLVCSKCCKDISTMNITKVIYKCTACNLVVHKKCAASLEPCTMG